jgi:hypothetical protein
MAVGAALVAAPAAAQDRHDAPDARPWFATAAKWGKWPTLAAAIGFTAVAITRKAEADDYFDRLQLLCAEQPEDCRIAPGGTYALLDAESLYQETRRLDGRARQWMIGGQGFLFVSGGLFVIDLVTGSRKPQNIPFAPFEAFAAPGTLGVRWRF